MFPVAAAVVGGAVEVDEEDLESLPQPAPRTSAVVRVTTRAQRRNITGPPL
jgi:hypothetical protein